MKMTKKKMTTSLATYITTLILSLIGHIKRKIALFWPRRRPWWVIQGIVCMEAMGKKVLVCGAKDSVRGRRWRRCQGQLKEGKTKFIMPTNGQISNWTWVGFSNSMRKMSCNASSNVLFNIFNKMNFDLAYFDVSYNIEILHLNDSNEFQNEINNNWKWKLNIWNQLLKILIWAMMRIHA